MNPSSGEMPQFELPPPPSEQAPTSPGSGQESGKEPERRTAAAAERASTPPPMLPSQPSSGQAGQAKLPKQPQADDDSTTKGTKKPLLDDTDLIEKEWVNKAKRIVENTRNDPHKQSEELTVVKAEYMKQQYGKTIKLK